MSADHDPRVERMEKAYASGDHQRARSLAKALLGETAQLPSEDSEAAQRVLQETEPDRFIFVVALVGLGVLAWLVYNYVL